MARWWPQDRQAMGQRHPLQHAHRPCPPVRRLQVRRIRRAPRRSDRRPLHLDHQGTRQGLTAPTVTGSMDPRRPPPTTRPPAADLTGHTPPVLGHQPSGSATHGHTPAPNRPPTSTFFPGGSPRGAQGAGHIEAVHVGRTEVQQDGIVGRAGGFGQAACADAAPGGRVAVAVQAGFQMAADDVVVFGDEDTAADAVRCGGRTLGRQRGSTREDRLGRRRRSAHRSRSSSTAGRLVRRIPFSAAARMASRAASAVSTR